MNGNTLYYMKMLLSFYLLCMNSEVLIIGVQVDQVISNMCMTMWGNYSFDFEFWKQFVWGEGEFPGPPPPYLFDLASERLRVCCKEVVKMFVWVVFNYATAGLKNWS